MGMTKKAIEEKMTLDKVQVLITCLEVIVEHDPVGLPIEQYQDVCRNALKHFKEE